MQIRENSAPVLKLIKIGITRSLKKRFPALKKSWETDTVVISYPKSGRSWLRTILDDLGFFIRFDHGEANVLYSRDKTFVPDSLPPRHIKEKKKIFLVRDPRDILVSSFFEATKRQNVFGSNISDFIRHPEFGIKPLLAYHRKWLGIAENSKNFIIEKYENLLNKPVKSLNNICCFISGHHLPEKKIRSSLSAFSFESMKRMEKTGIFRIFYGKKLKAANTDDGNSYKVRKGEAGGYVNYLSKKDIKYCNECMRKFKSVYT